jgi:glycosyltransferase involved in cell wall biosynthesis
MILLSGSGGGTAGMRSEMAKEHQTPDATVRVLHVSDHLSWGGTERLIWDIIRLSQDQINHRVVTFFPEGFFGPFVYADRLRSVGSYRIPPPSANGLKAPGVDAQLPAESVSASPPSDSNSLLRLGFRKVPTGWKSALGSLVTRVSHWLRWTSFGLRLHVSAAFRILREFVRFRPHVVHVHGFYPFMFGVFFKTCFRTAVVHTVPGTFAQMTDQGTGWLPNLYQKYHRNIDRFFLAAAYREQALSVGVPAEKLISVSGGIDIEEATRIRSETARYRAEVRTNLRLPDDALIALSIGRLHSSKGYQYGLEALARLVQRFPNLHWVLLGEGEMRTELERRRSELRLKEHAHFIGFVRDPMPFCAAADVFLRTSVLEGDNLSSYNALAMGLPTVGFETENRGDLIAQVGHGLLARNRDPDALADMIERVLLLPDRGREMGSRAIEFCHAHLDMRADVGNFVSAYRALYQAKNKSRDASIAAGPNGDTASV